ncbi:MAG: hypothetical protein ABIO04_11870 [Ferruginibacter sp.]
MKLQILIILLIVTVNSASAQKVGINNPNPQYELDVTGNSASNNQVSIIPLWQGGSEYVMANTAGQDLSNCQTAIDPTLYSTDGNIEIKLVVRITSSTATVINFQLRAHNGLTESFPIVFSDAWSYTNPQSGIIAISPWKSWSAGTTPLQLHLFGWVDAGSANFVSAYIVIRPKRT